MKSFFNWSRWWPVLLLTLLVSVLLVLNYRAGHFLAGWDNLQMELGPQINLERAWQAAWEEYQGLGLEGGMAHAADLFRQLFFWPLNYLLPLSLVRYVWHYLMVLTGVLSSYAFLRQILISEKISRFSKKLLALCGASFYMLNFASVQNFYTTFEPFAAFFAFLPLLLLLLIKIFLANEDDRIKDKNNLLLAFMFTSLIATSIAYVQTVFVVYIFMVLVIFTFFVLRSFFIKKTSVWQSIKLPIILGSIIFIINAFWFLPVSHFMLSDNAETLQLSKGKEMSNDILYFKNKSFGNFYSLARMQSFWLDETDFNISGDMVFLMEEWRVKWEHPSTQLIAWSFFVILLLGLVKIFKDKHPLRWLLFSSFLLSLVVLGNDLFPFKYLVIFLQKIFPFFYEMFRIAFTKWVIPFSFFYTVFVTLGLTLIFSFFRRKISHIVISLIFFASLIFYSWPSFQGHYFYQRLQVKIPDAYFELFSYFKDLSPSTRIANLPQHSFYGWQWNSWGYHGSGFLWYGIKQPILDRAFDVWSVADERYYWQLQSALDKKDVKILENVLSQYDVDYLLLDNSIVNRNTIKPLNYEAIKELLAGSKRLKLIEQFDFITLYEFSDEENKREKDFISLYDNLPLIDNQHNFAWTDQAYLNFHDYLSNSNNHANKAKIIYPFSSFFTNHLQKDLEFELSETQDFFYLSSLKKLPKENYFLELPDLLSTENYLPFSLNWRTEDGETKFVFRALLPEIYWQKEKYYFDFAREFSLSSSVCVKEECYLNINNQLIGDFKESGRVDLLLSTNKSNSIALTANNKTEYFDYVLFDFTFNDLDKRVLKTQEDIGLLVKVPKILVQSDLVKSDLNIFEAENCRPLNQGSFSKEFKMEGNYYTALGTSTCDRFYLGQLLHQASYLFKLDVDNFKSTPFIFAIQAESLGRSPLETYLSDGVNYQILPAIENFNQGYTLYLSTDSYGRELNGNLLKSAEVFAWPYNFLNNLYLQDQDWNSSKANLSSCDFKIDKKALWLYQADSVDNCYGNYLKLSQAYDRGWLAIQDGKILPHEKFNNWANAWVLSNQDSHSSIYIFFWPQLLQYLGFTLLLTLPCFFIKKMR